MLIREDEKRCCRTVISGDRIFQYSDGVTEAHDINKNLYGEERLLERLNKNRTAEQEQTIADVWKDNKDFPVNVGAKQFDKGALPIPVPSLILFTLSGQISHSMIAIGTNRWQGANNLGSLGAPDAEI